ncbi:DUF1367 family protein [Zavarzinia compransoris]|uniref:DUF1367 family protein n=1 Tax=Zavarzinia marina TaxID=2911065 RepID=UPI001F301BFB|nr:DUF1367 family protein [Zavarzinia marina]MCF4166372.1 DUF1367 family protein [Zavarzinia marina]
MAKGYFAKHLGALRPADEDAEAIMRAIAMGECVEITVQRKRNPRHHRKLFALLGIVVENTDGRWPNSTALLEDLKMAIGLFEKRVSIKGPVYYVPKSISFASMDQAEFSKVYSQMVDVIVARILPGVDRADLEREVMQMIEPGRMVG